MAMAEVNGINLFHRFDGLKDGMPVVLSNSLLSRLEMWDPQIEALTGAGYRVLR